MFSFYEGIELVEMWRIETSNLEPWFAKNERKWHESGGKDMNNPKIPVNFIRRVGNRIHEGAM